MKVRIRIRTPKGYARSTELRMRPMIIGKANKLTNKVYANKNDDTIIWIVEGGVRDIMRISNNVNKYELIIKGVFNNKMFKKVYLKKLSEQGKKDLKNLLTDQTKIDVVKEASAEELIESKKTVWSRIKEKIKKA